MRNPKHNLFWMSIYLFIVCIVCALIYAPLHSAFQANWVFNTLIISVLIIGIVISYRQVVTLIPELEWIASFRTGDSNLSVKQEPRLLKPLTFACLPCHCARYWMVSGHGSMSLAKYPAI